MSFKHYTCKIAYQIIIKSYLDYQFQNKEKVEISSVKRRNKKEYECYEDWKNYDTWFLNQLIERVGCNPTYLKIQSQLPNCSEIHEYRSFKDEFNFKEGIPPSCKSIEKLTQTMFEQDLGVMCALCLGQIANLL